MPFIKRTRLGSLVESPLALDELKGGALIIVDDVGSATKQQEAANAGGYVSFTK